MVPGCLSTQPLPFEGIGPHRMVEAFHGLDRCLAIAPMNTLIIERGDWRKAILLVLVNAPVPDLDFQPYISIA